MPENTTPLEDVFYRIFKTHTESKDYVLHVESDSLLGEFWDKMEDAKESV